MAAIKNPKRRAVIKAAGRLLAATAAPALLGANPAFAAPPARPTGQVVIGITNEPTVFNPLMLGLSVDQGVWWNLFDPLWGIDPAGGLIPKLAREVPTVENGGLSADGLTYRVRLRDDVKWHDGTPFTAADVKYTIELLSDPKFRAPSRDGHELVTDIRVVNDHEISWRMSKPFAPYLSILSWTFMVPKHVLGKSSDPNTAPFNSAPVGTGPFRWQERRAGDYVIVSANPAYYGGAPYLERLIFKYIPDLSVLYTQFRAGQIDYLGTLGITPDHYQEAKSLPGRTIHVIPAAGIENVTLNVGHPALAEKAVRHALYMGMDKQSIIDAFYLGLPKPVESYLPVGNWAYDPNLPKHEFSPDKANRLLDDAGWKRGADGIRVKNGVRLAFANSTPTGNQTREQTQQYLAQSWAKIGVSLSINNMPGAVMWGKFWQQSQFDSFLTYTDCTVASDPDVRHRFGSGAIPAKGGVGSNIYQFQNQMVDHLVEDGVHSSEQSQRKADYWKVQEIMRDQLVMLPLFQIVQLEGTKSNLKGFQPNVNVRSNAWNAARWYWA
ncbi:ABC transporter substrate-binding protein [Burkholderia sp. SG-MS1]|uniref:peptide ABC transporter substrate-binding protein n=1 Tax=Paraburkholderia sp. SG-MS1 TaxID=2023741 RepID=UPI001446A0E8|nr:peptide ABC transporter substrate-binding protein [Paraburkholderia sp. SG-MS1]NKJ45619.1 ABC transporter substrate-binding protein [Paraburkholderia sp. SG-MS1]